MEIEDDTITVHDNEIEAVKNQNAILEDDIVEGIITTDENEEKSANKNDIVTMEISDVLTNTILVEEHDDEARTANIDEVVIEEGGTAKADTTLEKEDVSGCLIGLECKQSVANDKETKRVHITRTGCKALIRVKLQGNGCYAIINHVKEHNHELTRPEWSHLHRSERQITDDKEIAIEDMISSGLKPTDSFRYMAHDAGGEDCIGHTLRDHLNYVNRLRMEAIEGGDANSMTEMLYEQASQETDFFFRIRHDDMGRLCSVFWRDSMMREDYNVYADEKTESFEWLFEVFKKSMGGKTPVTIFTDQDLAMGNAIAKVYPLTRHRLCQWHLYQNDISCFGKLKHDKSFKDAFQKCLRGCDDELGFESCWKSMITEYEIEKNSWFSRLYDLKAKWCTTLNKNFFSGGMLSTQRSESTNSAIGVNAKKTTNLTEFY